MPLLAQSCFAAYIQAFNAWPQGLYTHAQREARQLAATAPHIRCVIAR
ncbi:MAG: hypothetical protein ACREQN_02080 [Candidatus Binataceae bacterium]